VTPSQHADDRGVFLEWFRADEIERVTGRSFTLRQANLSSSRRGVARGIHFSDVPPGQAKNVTAIVGSVVDYVIDLRVGSPTFGAWDSVEMDDENRKAVFVPEGVGHLYVAVSDQSTVCYLTSDVYKPQGDRTISLLDPEIGLVLPFTADELVLSPKDDDSLSLAAAREQGVLPSWADCVAVYAAQASGRSADATSPEVRA
jgi:dTDP-4-dehydrorhamnose 3,5-epimerase